MDDIPAYKLTAAWHGRERNCPGCGNSFVSRFDKGQCPACGHIFDASKEHGIPDDVDAVALARRYDEEENQIEEARKQRSIVSPDESDRIIALLRKPAKALPDLPRRKSRSPIVLAARKEREEETQRLRDAMAGGGELWHWSTSEESWRALCGSGGFAVVKDGRVIAYMLTTFN